MSIEIAPLAQEHLLPAAELFSASYREFRRQLPVMPERYGQPKVVLPLLRSITRTNPGVAAFDNGLLTGYLTGFLVPNLKGRDSGAYCPEYAHAASGSDRAWIYRRMYESIARTWVEEKCLNHAVTILADDRQAVDAWFWSGFGLLVVDMVRGVEPLGASDEVATWCPVRRAVPADLARLLPLLHEHESYYHNSPMFQFREPASDSSEFEALLRDHQVAFLVADDGANIHGFIRIQTRQGDASAVVRDNDSAAIAGAYVRPVLRRQGVGRLLLSAAIEWARENGCRRVALDFEAANLYAARFWPRHFAPACYSVFRHVDDRVAT